MTFIIIIRPSWRCSC